jgi:hypothetical protein
LPPDSGVTSDGDGASSPGPFDSGTPVGPDSSGEPDSATPDTGVADAGGSTPDGSAPTPCTRAPCAQGGPNSIQCVHSPTSDGVCTPTEALIVANDVARGFLGSDGQLKPYASAGDSGSCYTCLDNRSCLDDDQQDVGNECSDARDLAGGAPGSGNTQCLAVLSCILTTDCQGPGGIVGTSAVAAQENLQLCYCGGDHAGSVCNTAGAATNGLCVQQEAAGLGFAYSDNKDILANYDSQDYPTGIANEIFGCAVQCPICR